MNRKAGKNEERKAWSARAMVLGLLLMAIFIGELLFSAWCRVECNQVRSEISRAGEKAERMAAVKEELKVELARLQSPERLDRIAETSMGLIMPTSRQMVVLE